MTKIIYPCVCGGEGVSIHKDDEDNEIELAFWSIGHKHSNGKMGFFERLRWCKHIMSKGEVYSDMIILKPEVALEVANKIKELLNENKQG